MPLENQLHVDSLLSNVSVKYRNQSYIAMELFPELAVKKSSDLYRVYERNFRVPQSLRSPKAVSKEWDFQVSTASYVLERHALKAYVSDNDADNYDLADLRAETTEELTDAILRRLEVSAASLMTKTSWSLTLSLSSTQCWNATISGGFDPIAHTDTGTAQVVLNSGNKPNRIAMGLSAKFALKNNPLVQDRVKYTSKEISDGILAALIGVEKFLVSSQVQDTADEGASTGANIQALWDDNVLLAFAPPAPGPLKSSAGYVFRKSVPMVKRWRVEERESDAIEVNMEYQVKVVSSLSGFLLCNVI